MDVIKVYGNIIKKNMVKKPSTSLGMIKLGLSYEYNRLSKFPEKGIPQAYARLNTLCLKLLLDSLKDPDRSAWVNLFAPTEILHSFGINPLSIEAFSSFMSGFKCEDFFIDSAEKNGIAETLCSYHKTFIGAIEAGVLPKPKFAITTSMVCDANINTFRYLSDKYKVPCYTIDVPNEYTKQAEAYVVEQLKEMINMIEEITGQKFDEVKLKETIERENMSKQYLKNYLKYQSHKYYPNTLTLQMYMLFTSHISIGTAETLDFYKLLYEDIKKAPESSALKVFWVHLLPFYHETLREYFNLNPQFQILGYDLNLDYLEEMDVSHPLESIAKKMLLNIYNGSYQRKISAIMNLVHELQADAVINFCHWGCKQSSGGVMLLKEALKKESIPMLIIDGDGVDRRNSHNGQIKTRLEAFWEIIEKQKSGDNNDRICM